MDETTCAVDGCDKASRTLGWCGAHYMRFRRTGSPTGSTRRVQRRCGPCSVDGCDKTEHCRGMCQTHYTRWKKHGDPTVVHTAADSANARRLREQEALSGKRVCKTCAEAKPLEDFPLDRRSRDGRRPHCRPCWREIGADGHQRRMAREPRRHAGRSRNHYLRAKYGITHTQYEEMVAAQHGVCAVCGRAKSLVVDHCHRRGAVRALLCNDCNLALGHVRDDPAVLRALIAYLQEHSRRAA